MAPKKVTGKGKKVAEAPAALKKTIEKAPKHPLFEKRPKNFGIGQDIQPKRNLSRFVKWPKYVRVQRQRRILTMRLKVPPSVWQFTKTLDKNLSSQLFKLLAKYKPEDRAAKKERLNKAAQEKADGAAAADSKKPVFVKYGLNHIVELVEQKKALLVVIAHDVDPIEMVLWLPALCHKMDVPYCIVKGKARLGEVVHKKKATVVAFTGVRPDDKNELAKLIESVRGNFNDRYTEIRKQWGGGIMGIKSQHKQEKIRKAMELEEAKRMTA
ncbi:60S ribosomal protein L7a-2 [Porphyridium purpureum]|uniref:60S ribosomal protein L7a n=1 Tax=Porphyridium purpureum TaxID=35688 RepID=A0A5J4Z3R9_PORPP|nr:60S ribosomal protein L7a-2 [Porphyridium purpureum]|eukprot:POR8295..scf295_1